MALLSLWWVLCRCVVVVVGVVVKRSHYVERVRTGSTGAEDRVLTLPLKVGAYPMNLFGHPATPLKDWVSAVLKYLVQSLKVIWGAVKAIKKGG
jgi:hypothetical protein